MFNMQSPIVNNIIGGGMGNTIPPNPIDNTINIGGMGYNQQQFNPYANVQQQQTSGFNPYQQMNYQQPMMQQQMMYQQPQIGGYQQPMINNYQQPQMGGYYNSIYNGYYNPYLAQRQQELYEAQQKELQMQQSNIWKMLSRGVNKALGKEVDDQYLSMYDPVTYDTKEQKIYEQFNHFEYLDRINSQGTPIRTPASIMVENNIKRYELAKERFPDDTSLYDFLANAGELYAEMLMDKAKHEQRQLNRLYNQNDYQQLVNLHNKTGSYYNQLMNNNPSIDDMEITLPSHLSTEYQRRKQAFINSIMGGGNNG